MPPFLGWNVFFTDGRQTITVKNGEGVVETEDNWVVVTIGNRVTSYPLHKISYVEYARP